MADLAMRASNDALLERLLRKTVAGWGGCLIWTGATNQGGYGVITHKGKSRSTHRTLYELKAGPIPKDHHLDHLCRVRRCINPHHLEPVTREENSRRVPRTKRNRDRCFRDHLLHRSNTRFRPAGSAPGMPAARECLRCWSERDTVGPHAPAVMAAKRLLTGSGTGDGRQAMQVLREVLALLETASDPDMDEALRRVRQVGGTR